jgi:cellulose synthase/poly-beta-1,6-N-acetylglucosamine synthase-like glycosyltransferase
MSFFDMVLWGWAGLVYLEEAFLFCHALRFRKNRSVPERAGAPPVTLIVPFKGEDFEMEKNILAFLEQDYSKKEVIFVAHSRKDPSYRILKKFEGRAAILVRDPKFGRCSYKLASQLTGLEKAGGEILAFADSDVRPQKNWLRELINPLSGPRPGASTSSPWYIPPSGSLPSCLQAAWNSSAGLAILPGPRHNFVRDAALQ